MSRVPELLFTIVLAVAWAYWLIACWCVALRVRRVSYAPADEPAPAPPVSVLKPLKGAEPELYDNLASFCRQEAPDFEILFGVRDPKDPAVAVVRRLQRQWPDRPLRLLIAPDLGANPKVAILRALCEQARHDVLVISDSDIRVGPDYLRRVVGPLRDPRVALVTCLYRARGVRRLAEALEALYIDFTFLPSVAVDSLIPRFRTALGATIALRRGDLRRAGGFEAIADHLADDHAVAAMLTGGGRVCRLSSCVVEHAGGSMTGRDLWQRGVRWARTIRSAEPRRYLGLPVTFALPWAALLVAASGGAEAAWWALVATLALRVAVAGWIAPRIGDRTAWRWLVWLPVRDVLDVAIWCAGLAGNAVVWRGVRYRVRPDGRLAPGRGGRRRPGRAARSLRDVPRRWVVWLDRRVRAREQIFEFTQDPSCMLRARWARATRTIVLSDGTRVNPGDRYVELHLWNEHLARPGRPAAQDLAWAASAWRRTEHSLRLLAQFLESREDLRDIRAVHGRAAFAPREPRRLMQVVRRFGFEVQIVPSTGLRSRLHDLGENVLIWGLAWAFNPGFRGGKVLSRPRHELWMSRDALIRRYGAPRETLGAVPSRGRSRSRSR
ncbi:MAG TPA: bacteriohopanetetrol glucosamine biosynthesis glycosyltransferase HpnI [Methylomirabilota bacterium]|nr:bacteriohopanetetrol glucosamine biosynthesis glycosyltransferase HpnI [Methylomirabilota bacterium]